MALRGRWQEHRDGIYALVLLLVGTHMAYLFEIGGDHFEYRPMDHYWPLLAVPAAEGLSRVLGAEPVQLAAAVVSGVCSGPDPRLLALLLFLPLLFYANAIQAALLLFDEQGIIPSPKRASPATIGSDR